MFIRILIFKQLAMNKTLSILFMSFFLLIHSHSISRNQRSLKKPSKLDRQAKLLARKIKGHSQNKLLGKFIVSIIFGFKRGIPKSWKRKLQILNLLHLFTPSGLHFSAILFFLTPLLNKLSRYHINLKKVFLISICISPFFLTGFYSLKRIALLKILSTFISRRISFFWIFQLTFIIDFLRGSYFESPLSFTYSYLFLGILISQGKFSFQLMLALFTGQILLSFSQQQSINLLGPMLGMGVTTLFTFFFPLLLISLLFIPFIGTIISEFLMSSFLKVIELVYFLAKTTPNIQQTSSLLFIMILIISAFSFKTKKTSFLAFFSVYTFKLL